MTKKNKNPQKFGRPEEEIEDLPRRFREMKNFLENYWGRIGLRLKTVNEPEQVRTILNLVPNVEWNIPFRGHATCLIAPLATKTTGNEVRETRRKLKESTRKYEQLWSEYLDTNQAAQQATTALNSAIVQFQLALGQLSFFVVIFLIATELKVEEVNRHSRSLEASAREAQKERNLLQESLRAQEAWFARNEIVKFAHNKRHARTLLNFARAMAGLPEWGWFHSRRMCEPITYDPTPTPPQQIFELITSITRNMKPVKLKNVEKRLRSELLNQNANYRLRDYVTPHWSYLQEAIRYCEGKGFKRSALPYTIMDRFLYHLERSKTPAEFEIAKANQLK
jgi:hypothetical protein